MAMTQDTVNRVHMICPVTFIAANSEKVRYDRKYYVDIKPPLVFIETSIILTPQTAYTKVLAAHFYHFHDLCLDHFTFLDKIPDHKWHLTKRQQFSWGLIR